MGGGGGSVVEGHRGEVNQERLPADLRLLNIQHDLAEDSINQSISFFSQNNIVTK